MTDTYHISFDATLKKNTYPGTFIAIEGIDGSGKSTQVDAMEKYLVEKGEKVSIVRWPRKEDGLVARVTQDFLQGKNTLPSPAFQYLLSADYVIHSEEFIIPALKRGEVVITDRCHFWSAVVYGIIDQGGEYDLAFADSLLTTHGVLTRLYQFVVPDITYFLSLDANQAIKRLQRRSEKSVEVYEKAEVIKNTQRGYEWLLQKFPEQFMTIDAERPIEQITLDMVQKMGKLHEGKNKKNRQIIPSS